MIAPTTGKNRLTLLAVPALMAALGVALYANALHAPFEFDDYGNIVGNPAITDAGDPAAVWAFIGRRFIGFYTFALNYSFNGLDTTGWHIVNLLIHIGTAIAAWSLIRRMLETPGLKVIMTEDERRFFSLGCGLIVLAHPLQTQAVTYIVQRLASLVTLFYLISVTAYMRGRMDTGRRRIAWFTFAGTSGVAALFTKETAVTIPLAILLCEAACFSPTVSSVRERVRQPASWIALVAGITFVAVIPVLMMLHSEAVFPTIISPVTETPNITPLRYLFTQFGVIVRYFQLLVVPFGQNIDHDVAIQTVFLSRGVLAPVAILMLVLSAGLCLFRRKPLMTFGIFWIFVTLSVESTIRPLNNPMFEHRLYLPMTGFAMIVMHPLLFAYRKKRLAGISALIMLVALYSVLTVRRNALWADPVALWTDAGHKSPAKARPWNNLGNTYYRRGDYINAAAAYERAMDTEPRYFKSWSNYAGTLFMLGRREKAVALYEKAASLIPGDPEILFNYGSALLITETYGKAAGIFRKALSLPGAPAKTMERYGDSVFRLGDNAAAADAYRDALTRDTENTALMEKLGTALALAGSYDEAVAVLSRGVEREHDNAGIWNNLGTVFLMSGAYEKAVGAFERAVTINPGYGQVYRNLGDAFTRLERYDDAVRAYSRAQTSGNAGASPSPTPR